MAQQIVYIKSISCSVVSDVSECNRILNDMAAVTVAENPVELPLAGLAKFVVSSSVENKSRRWTSVLTARLSEPFTPGNRQFIFFLTATDGSKFVLGSGALPYPKVNFASTMPENPSDPVSYDLTVEYVDIFGLTRLILTV